MGELILLVILAGVQFTHILDFMIVMPLGPQLMRLWQIRPYEFALLFSAYTFTAAAAALLCSLYIDRFDRRKALLALYGGFALSTLLCALAPSYGWLLTARAAAGAFGGVAGAAVYSILGDLIPETRRGRAMGVLMTAFPVSAVVGVPLGLFLANHFGWRAPFVLVFALSLLVLFGASRLVPPLHAHVEKARLRNAWQLLQSVFADANHRQALAFMAVLVFGGFSVIPFIAPYMVSTVRLRESDLTYLYFFGGLATVFTSRLIGRLTDRHGKRKMFTIVALVSIVPLLITTNLRPVPVWIAIAASVLFMVFVSGRFVPAMAIVTAAAQPGVRGGFMSVSSAVQQLASALASLASGVIIGRGADGSMTRYWLVGLISIACVLLCIRLARRIETRG
ncbi:MAG TPA: MFS transporter [Burkholderiales bacterium]|nr:MFS transporter [Burkholderiales bacterium]